jgi:pyruvate dehydrogenase E2 component (dihydrolipoamide acetyltransferase)
MEPFREVRSPERNFGPARLAGGTVTTPLARRLAGEAGIDLSNVKGSGPHGRIVARDVETARSAAPAYAPAAASMVLTADVMLGRAVALCADVTALELTDVIVKAWATALGRVMSDAPADIALAAADGPVLIRDAASRTLTAISSARREPAADAEARRASTAVFITAVPGIASVAFAVRPPQTTMLSIGSRRRVPAEAPDGSVAFADTMTVTLTCDHRVVDGALGAELLSAFKGFVEQPVTMLV